MDYKSRRVFISYAREDEAMALKLYDDLTRHGVDAWLDSKNLKPGEDWKRAIRRAIEESRFFLALTSSNSIRKRGHVQSEIKHASEARDDIPPDDIFVIPVRLDDCEPPYEWIKSLHYVDLFRSYSDGLGSILRVVAEDIEFSADGAEPSNVKTSPSGRLGLFKPVLDRSADATKAKIRERLDLLLTSSSHGRRLVENLWLESRLGDDDWAELVKALERAEPDVSALLEAVMLFSRERILLGDALEDYAGESYFCFRYMNSVVEYMMSPALGMGTSKPAARYLTRLFFDDRGDFQRYLSPGAYLGRDPMWSTFSVDGDLGGEASVESLHDARLSLGLDRWSKEEMLLFEYKLTDDTPPRLPTFCDLYSSVGWQIGESVTLPYAKYSWTAPANLSVRPRPEVVHKSVTVGDVIKIRLLPKLT